VDEYLAEESLGDGVDAHKLATFTLLRTLLTHWLILCAENHVTLWTLDWLQRNSL